MSEARAYGCISYVWAELDTFCLRNLCLDGELSSTELHTRLLAAISKRFGTVFLWFDRFCLVEDARERERELQRMGIYYGGAKVCVALLREIEDEPQEISRRLAAGWFTRRIVTRAISSDFEYYSAMIGTLASSGFCDDPWFTRVWTALEFCRSKRCMVWDGCSSVDLTRLAAILFDLEQRQRLAVKSSLSRLPKAFGDTMLLWRESLGDWLDLAQCLQMTKARDCSVEEDRVYGLLGFSDRLTNCPVSYGEGLDAALSAALTTALRQGDISALSVLPPFGRGLSPSYGEFVEGNTSVTLARLGRGDVEVDDTGITVPLVIEPREVRLVPEPADQYVGSTENFHWRTTRAILHWMAWLATTLEDRPFSAFLESLALRAGEEEEMGRWIRRVATHPLEAESILDLHLDMTEDMFFPLGRRLYRGFRWTLVDFGDIDLIDGCGRFALANLCVDWTIEDPTWGLFVDSKLRGEEGNSFFLLGAHRDGRYKRTGLGVRAGFPGRREPTRVRVE